MKVSIQNGQLKIKFNKPSTSKITRESVVNFVFNRLPFVLLILVLPISLLTIYLSTSITENDVFRNYLLVIGASSLLFFSQLFLSRRKVLFDPNGLSGVLVFNLILTLTVILNTSDNVSSTFSTVFFRSGSGIALISFIVLFYLLSYFTNRFHSIFESRLFKYTILVVYLFAMARMILATSFLSLFEVIYGVTFTVLMFTLFRNRFAKSSYEKVLGLLLVMLFAIKIASGAHSVRYGNPLTVLAVTYLMIVLFQIWKRRKNLPKLRNLTAVAIFPALISLWLVTRFVFEKNSLNVFLAEFGKFFSQFNVLAGGSLTTESILPLLVGRGSDFLVQTNSFASNILVSSGVIGIIGYFVMWAINIVLSAKLFKRNESSQNAFKLFYSILFVILSFFTNMPLIMTILWWIVFTDNAVLFAKNKPELRESSVYKLIRMPKVKNEVANKIFGSVLLFGFIVVCVILISFITRNII